MALGIMFFLFRKNTEILPINILAVSTSIVRITHCKVSGYLFL